MSDKTLKITFSGICTLTPAETTPATDKVYVMMPAAREENVDPPAIKRHYAFVYVPEQYLVSPPDPAFPPLHDDDLGPTRVYLVDHARAALDSVPMSPPRYFVDEEHNVLPERPGSADAPVPEDLRWMVDFREVIPAATGFAPGCDPAGPAVKDTIAMVVELKSGILKANFPCASVQPQVFQAGELRLDIKRRVYAPEFTVEITYPADAGDVRLKFTPLREDAIVSGVAGDELVLHWMNDRIELRMGNDTESEIQALINLERCNIPLVRSPRDNDFALHYNEFNLAAGVARPLPVAGTLHSEHNGCLGGVGG